LVHIEIFSSRNDVAGSFGYIPIRRDEIIHDFNGIKHEAQGIRKSKCHPEPENSGRRISNGGKRHMDHILT
jgi:hypothetical protein